MAGFRPHSQAAVRIERHDFASPRELAAAMAGRVADQLEAAIGARAQATLAVSGGSTPVRFFEALAGRDLNWSGVTVTLVDERFVPPDHARSNERLVRRHLLQGNAEKAGFLGLRRETQHVNEAAIQAALDMARLPMPIDVVVLGMGTDGHTASFFADARNFRLLIDPLCPEPVLPVEAPSAGESRLTLTLPPIAQARFLALHIEGAEKAKVLDRAIEGAPASELPIRAVLDHAVGPLHIFHAP